MLSTCAAVQASPEVGLSEEDREPRFSLLDGRYHEQAQSPTQGSGSGDPVTALATRDMSALTVQKGASLEL